MRRVRFDPSELAGEDAAWWESWERRASNGLTELKRQRAAGEEVKFNGGIWKQLKEWLFEHVFEKRCAYCDGKSAGQSFPRGEHWRPKGGVADEDGGAHPGYWWLAYEWTNLLPSCERCNSKKSTQFPIAATRTFEPEEDETLEALDQREQPLLLHPLRGSDPGEHLTFDEFGGIFERDESRRGAETIRVLGLDRDDLEDERREAQKAAVALVDKVAAEACLGNKTFAEAAGDQLEGTPFVDAIKVAVARRLDEHRERFEQGIGEPPPA